MSNPVPETTAPRPCRHESSVSNKIQQHANKKAKKNRPRQVPECEHIKSPFLPHISFSSAWLAMNPAPWTPENFHRPAEIHLPSGKSIGQIFFRHHRHQKTRPNHVPQKTIPRSTCYWIFLPNPVPKDVPSSWRASTSNNHAILQRNNKSCPWDIHLPHEGEKNRYPTRTIMIAGSNEAAIILRFLIIQTLFKHLIPKQELVHTVFTWMSCNIAPIPCKSYYVLFACFHVF